MTRRILSDISLSMLPRVDERTPFLYLERCRIEVDDASVKAVDAAGVTSIPAASILGLWLGPGTSITHEAVKALAKVNCQVSWVGEDGLVYYASGAKPTASTRSLEVQVKLHADPDLRTEVARKMFEARFGKSTCKGKTIPEMMGMEGHRVRDLYRTLSAEIGVDWEGRRASMDRWKDDDPVNRAMTAFNSALYSICLSCIHSLGYSPHLGFIHSGSPLPLVYDIADLYKEELTIRPAFLMFRRSPVYNKDLAMETFREACLTSKLLQRIPKDLKSLLKE